VLRSQIITSPPVQRQSIVMTCLSVCLSVHEHISGTTSPIFTRFLLSPDSECGVWDEHVCVCVCLSENLNCVICLAGVFAGLAFLFDKNAEKFFVLFFFVGPVM